MDIILHMHNELPQRVFYEGVEFRFAMAMTDLKKGFYFGYYIVNWVATSPHAALLREKRVWKNPFYEFKEVDFLCLYANFFDENALGFAVGACIQFLDANKLQRKPKR